MIASDNTINILGFHTSTLSKAEILTTAAQWIESRKASHHLMALNPIKVCRARKEHVLAVHIAQADLLYPDAYGIAWAMAQFSGTKYPVIPGCDLMYDLMQLASEKKYKVYLLGGSQSVVETTKQIFQRDYSGATIVGIRNGYFVNDEERQLTLTEILEKKPDIVLVAMGALIQENWIARIRSTAAAHSVVIPLCMGVGGSFDAVTGRVPRPPKWMLRLHLEWLFRLLQQPFRAPRMLALPHFAILVLAKKIFKINTDYRFPAEQKNGLTRLHAEPSVQKAEA